MSSPLPPIRDALAAIRRPSAAEALARLRDQSVDTSLMAAPASDALPTTPFAKPTPPATLRQVGASAVTGAGLGFGDEAVAGLAGLGRLAGMMRGPRLGGPGVTPSAALDSASATIGRTETAIRSATDSLRTNHPVIAFGTEALASLPLGGRLLGKMTPAPTVLGRVAQAARAGAKIGGVVGAGESNPDPEASAREELEQRGIGVGVGALTGAVAAPIIGGAVTGATQLGRRAVVALQEMGERGGITLPIRSFPKAATGGEGAAQDYLLERMGQDQQTPEALLAASRRNAAVGPKPETVADLSGRNVQGMAGKVAADPGPGKNAIPDFYESRNQSAAGRVTNALSRALGVAREDAGQTAEDLIARQKANAAPAYQAAYVDESGAPRVVGDKAVALQLFKMRQLFPQAFNEAQQIAAVNDIPQSALIVNGKPTVQYLDLVKRGWDRAIQAGKRASDAGQALGGERLRGLVAQQQRFLGLVDKAAPEFGAARAQFAGDEAIINAHDLGTQTPTMTPREIRQARAGFTPSELEAFNKGALDAHATAAEQTRSVSGDATKKLTGSVYNQDQLRALVGDTPFLGLKADLARESAIVRSNAAAQGSRTAPMLMEGQAEAQKMAQIVGHGSPSVGGLLMRGGRAAMNLNAEGLRKAALPYLSQYFTATGPELDALLEQLAQRAKIQQGTRSVGQVAGKQAARIAGTVAGEVPQYLRAHP